MSNGLVWKILPIHQGLVLEAYAPPCIPLSWGQPGWGTAKEDRLETVASKGRFKGCRVIDTCGDPDGSKTRKQHLYPVSSSGGWGRGGNELVLTPEGLEGRSGSVQKPVGSIGRRASRR